MHKGALIVFEGIDGAGLTTNSKFLTEWLGSLGFKSFYTKEPSKSIIGSCIREVLKKGADAYTLTLLFTADRALHVNEEIIPKLKEGFFVVCDRYYYSTLVYQSIHGVNEEMIRRLNRRFPKPDLVILLDVDPLTSLERKKGDREMYENLEFLEKARAKFLEVASEECFVVIPSSRPIERVQNDIKRIVGYFLEELGLKYDKEKD